MERGTYHFLVDELMFLHKREENNGLYVVARNIFLPLLNCSLPGPSWVLLDKIQKPFFLPSVVAVWPLSHTTRKTRGVEKALGEEIPHSSSLLPSPLVWTIVSLMSRRVDHQRSTTYYTIIICRTYGWGKTLFKTCGGGRGCAMKLRL